MGAALVEDNGLELQLKDSTSSSGLRKQTSIKGRRKVLACHCWGLVERILHGAFCLLVAHGQHASLAVRILSQISLQNRNWYDPLLGHNCRLKCDVADSWLFPRSSRLCKLIKQTSLVGNLTSNNKAHGTGVDCELHRHFLLQVKPIKPAGASGQPPPLAVRPPLQPTFNQSFAGPTYGSACEGWPQLLQQSGAWGQTCGGPAFTFVPTPTSTPTPSPDQGSMPFSYPRRPVLPAFCSAWHIPTQVQGPHPCSQAQQLAARGRSVPSESQPREESSYLEPSRSLDASLDASIDSVLDSDPLCLGADSDLFDSDFGDIFGPSEAQQHDVLETAAKLEALVAPEKASAGLPFGLRLKKSESFCNLINRHLAEARSSVSASQ